MDEQRSKALGPGRLLIAAYAVFALSSSARATFQLVTQFAVAPLAYVFSAFAALVYIAATIFLARSGKRWRRLAWIALIVEVLGVVFVGFLTTLNTSLFPRDTVWSNFGRGYGYVPLVLPLLGMLWLWARQKRSR